MVRDEVMSEEQTWRFVLALKAQISTLRGTHDEGILFIGHKIADTAYTTKRIETDNLFLCVVCSHRKTNDLNALYFNCLLKTLADFDKNDRLRTTRHVGSTHLSKVRTPDSSTDEKEKKTRIKHIDEKKNKDVKKRGLHRSKCDEHAIVCTHPET